MPDPNHDEKIRNLMDLGFDWAQANEALEVSAPPSPSYPAWGGEHSFVTERY